MIKRFFLSLLAGLKWIYKKIWSGKRKWILIVLIIGGGYWYYSVENAPKPIAKEDPITKVTRGDIESSIEVLGKSKLVHEQKLRFNIEGKVTSVLFNVGDKVVANQPLAKLDTNIVDNDIKQAELRVITAQNNLAKLYHKDIATDSLKAENQINNIKQQIASANVEYKNMEIDGDQKLKDSQNTFSQALKDFDNKKGDASTSRQDLLQDLINKEKDLVLKQANFEVSTKTIEQDRSRDGHDLEAKLTTRQKEVDTAWYNLSADISDIQSQLDSMNSIISVEPEHPSRYPDFTNTLFSARNTDYKNQAANAYWATKHQLETYEDELKKRSENVDNIKYLLLLNQKIYASLGVAANATYLALDNSIESAVVTSDMIGSLKSSMSSIRTASTNKIQAVKLSLSNIQSLDSEEMIKNKHYQEIAKREQSYKSEKQTLDQTTQDVTQAKAKLGIKETDLSLGVDKLSVSLRQSQADLDKIARENQLALMNKKQSITSLEQQLIEAKQGLKDLSKAPTREEVDNAQNEIKGAQIFLEQAKDKLAMYTLKAPFSGVVRKSDIKLGDNLTTNTESYIYIENPDLVEVTASLDQVDVVKVSRGQVAIVHFDAFPDISFSGSLSDVDSNPKEESGNNGGGGNSTGMSYSVHILIDRQKRAIYSGMTASVKIVTETAKKAIIVPTTAVLKEGGVSKVNKSIKGKKVSTEVKIGITDGTQTQVLSGLKEGDSIYEINFSDNGVEMPVPGANNPVE